MEFRWRSGELQLTGIMSLCIALYSRCSLFTFAKRMNTPCLPILLLLLLNLWRMDPTMQCNVNDLFPVVATIPQNSQPQRRPATIEKIHPYIHTPMMMCGLLIHADMVVVAVASLPPNSSNTNIRLDNMVTYCDLCPSAGVQSR